MTFHYIDRDNDSITVTPWAAGGPGPVAFGARADGGRVVHVDGVVVVALVLGVGSGPLALGAGGAVRLLSAGLTGGVPDPGDHLLDAVQGDVHGDAVVDPDRDLGA